MECVVCRELEVRSAENFIALERMEDFAALLREQGHLRKALRWEAEILNRMDDIDEGGTQQTIREHGSRVSSLLETIEEDDEEAE